MKSQSVAIRLLLSVLFLLSAASSVFAATATGTTVGGNVYRYHDISIPSPANGVRLVLSSPTANTDIYLYSGINHTAGTLRASSTAKTLHTLLVPTLTDGTDYHVRIRTANGGAAAVNYTFTDDQTYSRDLTWDTGASPGGTNIVSQPDTAGGDYVFKIVTPSTSSAYGAWRTALAVSSGVASVEIFKTTPPVHTTATPSNVLLKSINTVSEIRNGFILTPGAGAAQFIASQTWYVRVRAEVGATWNLYSGDVYVQNLGTIADDLSSSSLSATVGPEGTYYFRTTGDATTPAWKLWLNGSNLPLMVSNASAPVSSVATTYQQSETGQMLLVPPYLSSTGTYFVGVSAAPSTVFGLTSQKQPIIDLAHGATATNSVTGYGYITYRVAIPPEEVAWQVDLRRTSAAGNPELYLRSGAIPNVRNNSALSEAVAGIDDSITIVPVTGINPTGTWYITVKGSGSFDYSLVNKAPVVTDIPYLTDPASNTNDDPARSGWRYYRVTNLASFVGKLGWQIELDQAHRAGYEIAIRLNVAPGRWSSRSNDSATAVEYSTIHRNSTSGIFQAPNHQADNWYIGIYNPTQALGPFQLTTREIAPALTDISSVSAPVTDQDISTWRYFKFVVPNDVNLKGWDLRLKTTSGNPQMVIRREMLPETFDTSSTCASGLVYNCSTWPSSPSFAQWAAGVTVGGGTDWTSRYRTGAIQDPNNYLIMGMGSPLVPGTYYVGVARQNNSSNTAAMSYTLESRGIGLGNDSGGTPWPIQVNDLNFSGGVANGSGLAPREVEWYRVNVPVGADSWSLRLEPSVGEAMLAIRQGSLPNIAAWMGSNSSESGAGTIRHKNGAEYFYKFATGTAITSGDYYIAVISEGQNPANATTIGTGNVSYTLTSVGSMPVDATAPPTTLTTTAPITWGPQTLPYGSQKAYRFRFLAGLGSIEVRLNNKVGNPVVAIRQDPDNNGKLSYHSINSNQYPDAEGGYYDTWRSTTTGSIITIGSPVAGDYTITVLADYVNATNSDAGFNLEVAAVVPVDLAFDLTTTSSVSVTNQDYQTWRYFKVVIPEAPDAPNLKGWDLRLKATAGEPQMVVRRDQMPNTSTMTTGCGSPSAVYNCSTWGTGKQWVAGSGGAIDWTARYNAAVGVPDNNNYLIMGMESPLVGGTYYIGVASRTGTAAMTYTLESRSIGIGGSYPIQVAELSFNGGMATGTGLAPREIGWYKVAVPQGATSWSLNLVPEGVGEAMLAVRHGRLPNVGAVDTVTSDNASSFAGATRQKPGQEFFYKYPPAGAATTITSGDYYIAVISEGQNPANTTTIGSDTVNYTLTSVGTVPIDDRTATPVSAGAPVSLAGQSLPYGSEKVYRFRVPAGLDTLEVRLSTIIGNPLLSVRKDATGSGKIPSISFSGGGNYPGPHEGGDTVMWNYVSGSNKIVITPVAEGDYTISVKADYLNAANSDASFGLEIVGIINSVTTPEIPFANSTQPISGQDPATWRYFQVVVPADASLKGWDLRLKPTSGNPYMVVRRGLLPTTLTTSSSACGMLYQCSSWLTGAQWGSSPGNDWTGRTNLAAPNVPDYRKQLIMGMGSPLEPGTYYVGVSRYTSSSDATQLSYTLESRGIGFGNDSGGTPWPIQITDLNFSGGSASASNQEPRDVRWYRVAVPADAASWSLNLVPTPGEAMLALRQGRLPNIAATNNSIYTSDHATDFRGAVRQQSGSEFFYKYATAGQTVITSGEYYIAVISEGQDPPNPNTLGNGPVNYTLTSVGVMPVADTTAIPVGAATPATWSSQSVPLGQQKIYRFRLPDSLTAAEIKLNNKIGNPIITVRRDAAGGGKIPDSATTLLKPNEGGDAIVWRNRAAGDTTGGSSFITVASPAAGDYTVTVAADSESVLDHIDPLFGPVYTTLYVNAAFDLEVRALTSTLQPFTPGSSVSSSLGNNQVAYYRFEVPATVNGQPLLGWLLKSTTTGGAVSIRARQGQIPGDDNTGSVVSSNRTVAIVPPVLTPGTWYVEVKGIGTTAYTLTTDVVTNDPATYRRHWTMPARIGSFTQPGVAAPFFGDSGIADNGTPLSGDQGIDLELDGWHFYRITVPDNNSGLLRTELSVLNGRPQIYLRAGAVPGIDHYANPANPGQPPAQGQANAYDYARTPTELLGSLRNNWVPLDGRSATQLTPGEWWIGVRSQIVSSRYRLKLSVGDVHSAGGVRQDTVKYVQDLAQDGGSFTDQTLLAEDMRYYRVTVPQSSTTVGNSTPLSWNLTLNQTQGDVVVFVRDTIPPGQGVDGNVDTIHFVWETLETATIANSGTASTYFQDWYDDNSALSPNPYLVIDANGITTFGLPPVEPGKVYYLGVYARIDSTFNISSSVSAERLALSGVVTFTNSTSSATLNPGEEQIYRIDVPANATVWQHNSVNNSLVRFYLHQDTPPPGSGAHWFRGTTNNSLTQNLTGYPWQSAHSYYLRVRNDAAVPHNFSFTMSGQVAAVPEPVIAVSPASKDFGVIAPAATSPAQEFIISNSGTVELIVSSFAATGGDQAMFTVSTGDGSGGTCGAAPVIAAAGSCTISVTFTPGSGGPKSTTLRVASNDPATPNKDIGLSGTGELPQFTIQAFVVAGDGMITCESPVTQGNNSACTISTGMGSHLNGLSDNGTDMLLSYVPDSLSYLIPNVIEDHSVLAAFGTGPFSPNTRLNSVPPTYFALLPWAFNNVADTANVIQARDVDFTGNFVYGQLADTLLDGGYDSTFITQGGFSRIDGSLKVRSGLLRVKNIKVYSSTPP